VNLETGHCWQEKSRTVWGLRCVDTLVRIWNYGFRTLRKNPAFTLVAVCPLALGIGANPAIFSMINANLSKANCRFHNPEQLGGYCNRTTLQPGSDEGFSYPVTAKLFRRELPFTGVFAEQNGLNISNLIYKTAASNGSSEHSMVNFVTGNFFNVMGISAIAGRTFTSADDVRLGDHPVAVMSYRYWERRFGCDPKAVGKVFTLNGTPFTVIGVTPKDFKGVFIEVSPDFWLR